MQWKCGLNKDYIWTSISARCTYIQVYKNYALLYKVFKHRTFISKQFFVGVNRLAACFMIERRSNSDAFAHCKCCNIAIYTAECKFSFQYTVYIYSGYSRSWGKGDVGENVLLHGPQLFRGVNTVNHLEHFSHKCRLYSESNTGKKWFLSGSALTEISLRHLHYETNGIKMLLCICKIIDFDFKLKNFWHIQ